MEEKRRGPGGVDEGGEEQKWVDERRTWLTFKGMEVALVST